MVLRKSIVSLMFYFPPIVNYICSYFLPQIIFNLSEIHSYTALFFSMNMFSWTKFQQTICYIILAFLIDGAIFMIHRFYKHTNANPWILYLVPLVLLSVLATLSSFCNSYHITYLSASPSSSPYLSLYISFWKLTYLRTLFFHISLSTCLRIHPNNFKIRSKQSTFRIWLEL
jgi:hypothetical protein